MKEFNLDQIVMVHIALKLRELGYPQGKTPYLWHRTKPSKVSFKQFDIAVGDQHWIIYKRNKHDISSFGDSHGYNRWVSAPTYGEAFAWALKRNIEIFDEKKEKIDKLFGER